MIPNDSIYRFFISLFTGVKKPDTEIISFEDIFSGNVVGDLNYTHTFFGDNRDEHRPYLTLYYYLNGKIESVSIDLTEVSDRMDFLRSLYLYKKICIRIQGQIKRFELQ